MRTALVLTGLLGLTACGDPRFACSEDAQCQRGDDVGQCETTGYCSFVDEDCPSGRRYGDLAGGGFGGVCVQEDAGTEGSSGGSTTPATGTTGTTGTTETPDPLEPPTSSSSDGNDVSTGGAASSTTSSDPSAGSSGGDLLPDGSDCMTSDECQSGACYMTGLGGLCGECSTDDDCASGGCNLPNPLAEPPDGSSCNTGALGDGCETTDACQGTLQCAEIIDVPGIIRSNTCSECISTADCGEGSVCNISVDVSILGGAMSCVPPSTVVDGEFCDIDGDGEQACLNHCAEANLKGLITFGICGECREDVDCPDDTLCIEPEIGLDGTATASFCE